VIQTSVRIVSPGPGRFTYSLVGWAPLRPNDSDFSVRIGITGPGRFTHSHVGRAPLRPSDSEFGQNWKPRTGEIHPLSMRSGVVFDCVRGPNYTCKGAENIPATFLRSFTWNEVEECRSFSTKTSIRAIWSVFRPSRLSDLPIAQLYWVNNARKPVQTQLMKHRTKYPGGWISLGRKSTWTFVICDPAANLICACVLWLSTWPTTRIILIETFVLLITMIPPKRRMCVIISWAGVKGD
jgi:hypothetical protein